MKNIGIFYGTTTGMTAELAEKIAKQLGVDSGNVRNVTSAKPTELGAYDLIMLGCSTWGSGDMQGDMHDFLDGVSAMYMKGKQIAFFGCGDDSMTDTFCDGVGEMREMMEPTQAEFVGEFDTEGYHFEKSKAVKENGMAVGLLIDNTNHPELTDSRIKRWCLQFEIA